MTDELLSTLERLLNLGWPALVTVWVVVLWRRLLALEAELHECLKRNGEVGEK